VHSAVDFNLQIPANAALFYVLCTVAASELSRRPCANAARCAARLQKKKRCPHLNLAAATRYEFLDFQFCLKKLGRPHAGRPKILYTNALAWFKTGLLKDCSTRLGLLGL